jgi:hypothetical protein
MAAGTGATLHSNAGYERRALEQDEPAPLQRLNIGASGGAAAAHLPACLPDGMELWDARLIRRDPSHTP